MSLLTYQQSRPWAKAIRETALTGKMPPWHADPAVGQFSNIRKLNEREIRILKDWAESGAIEGSPKDAPKPRTFSNGWTIGKPDVVFEIPQDFEVPARGEVDYIHFAIPTNFTEDRWIQRVEVRPGTPAVVHHIGLYLRLKGSKWLPDLSQGKAVPIRNRTGTRSGADEQFAMYLPGRDGEILPDGQARLIPAGTELILQIHYTTIGKATKDRTRVGLVFATKPVVERIHTLAVGNAEFAIPPGEANYKVSAMWPLGLPVKLIAITPHMHLRGKAFLCYSQLPNKEKTELLKVPKFDRNWQERYILATPIEYPRGASFRCEATFDNSPNNPWNPNPKAEVKWGDQTREEMMVGYFEVAIPAQTDIKRFYGR